MPRLKQESAGRVAPKELGIPWLQSEVSSARQPLAQAKLRPALVWPNSGRAAPGPIPEIPFDFNGAAPKFRPEPVTRPGPATAEVPSRARPGTSFRDAQADSARCHMQLSPRQLRTAWLSSSNF